VGPATDGPAPPGAGGEEEGEGGGKEPALNAAPGPSAAFRLMVTRREPAVKLQYAVSGLEPLAWSEDHRVSVSTARSIAVLELICDVHNPGQDLVIHRTSVPAPLNSCLLKVSDPRAPALGSLPASLQRHPSQGKPGPHLVRGSPRIQLWGLLRGQCRRSFKKKKKSYRCLRCCGIAPTPYTQETPRSRPPFPRPCVWRAASADCAVRCLRLRPLSTQPQTCLGRGSHCLGPAPPAPGWLCLPCGALLSRFSGVGEEKAANPLSHLFEQFRCVWSSWVSPWTGREILPGTQVVVVVVVVVLAS
jgi:hypothetical protein